jgi:hypothetical protein
MPAFTVHKLLIASLPESKAKRAKDYNQVCAVAKKIITDRNLIAEAQRIFRNMPLGWRKPIHSSARNLQEFVVDCNVDFSIILNESR